MCANQQDGKPDCSPSSTASPLNRLAAGWAAVGSAIVQGLSEGLDSVVATALVRLKLAPAFNKVGAADDVAAVKVVVPPALGGWFPIEQANILQGSCSGMFPATSVRPSLPEGPFPASPSVASRPPESAGCAGGCKADERNYKSAALKVRQSCPASGSRTDDRGHRAAGAEDGKQNVFDAHHDDLSHGGSTDRGSDENQCSVSHGTVGIVPVLSWV